MIKHYHKNYKQSGVIILIYLKVFFEKNIINLTSKIAKWMNITINLLFIYSWQYSFYNCIKLLYILLIINQ